MADIRCQQCRGPVEPNTGRRVAYSAAEGFLWVCGAACQAAQSRGDRARRRCAGFYCPQTVAPTAGPGRPALYCQEKCRKATDRALRRGMAAVARGRVPDDPGQIRAVAHLVRWLKATWDAGQARELNRPVPPAPDAASLEFQRAAAVYLNRLLAALPAAQAAAAQAADVRRRQAAADELARIRAAGLEREQAWRVRVLESYAADEASLAELGVY